MFYKVFFWVFIIGGILLFIFPTTDATDKNYSLAMCSRVLQQNYKVIGNIYENPELLESEG